MPNYKVGKDLCPIYEDDEQCTNKAELVRNLKLILFSALSSMMSTTLTIPFMMRITNKNLEIMSEEIEWEINDIYLPEESMRSQSDSWSIKSYPVNSNVIPNNNDQKGENISTPSEENESMLCRRFKQVLGTPSTESKHSSWSGTQPEENNWGDSSMPAPPTRKRKHYPMPGKNSRKRKRK